MMDCDGGHFYIECVFWYGSQIWNDFSLSFYLYFRDRIKTIPINLRCVRYRDINTVIDGTNNIVLTVLNDPKQTRRWNIITSLANSNTQFEILQLTESYHEYRTWTE